MSMPREKISIGNFLDTFRAWPRMYRLIWMAKKSYFIGILILSIINGLIPAAMIILMERLVNQISQENDTKIVFGLFGLYMGLMIVSTILDTLMNTVKTIYQELLTKEIDMRIIEKASVLPYEYFEDHEIYDNIQRARNESTYRPFQIFDQTLGIISGLVTLASVAVILIVWKWWLIIVLLIIPLLSAFSFLKLGRQEFMLSFFQASKRRILYYITLLMTTDQNVKEIKTFDKTDTMKRKYVETYNRIFKENKKMTMRRFRTTTIFDLLTITIVGFVLLYLIYEAYMGLIAIGSLVAYIQAVNRTQAQSSSVLRLCFGLYENNLFLNQLFSFMDLPESTQIKGLMQPTIPNDMEIDESSLRFNDVSFTYPNRAEAALQNISLTIKPGEIVALVGENGSGKSTLTKLISRLFNPTEGTITYKGKLIQQFEIKEWKSKLSVVFQEFNRYELTAYENITLGGTEYGKKDVQRAACLSCSEEFLQSLPEKYSSQLGVWFEGGVQLSGGQWQKLAIARAFIRDAEIYVMDEPTSSIDGFSQEEIFNNFKEICSNKIGLFISHRLSNVIHADKIVVLKDGRIHDVGTHEQLLERCDLYNRLYNAQAGRYVKGNEAELSVTS
ncbi:MULTISPECIES: ABC transporter ATP-binding protein [Bacillus cereus group]|uniref:ABC transporter ATP-binding protein n=1 Tax=Bacillus cereus group TaxID=86661 RepID=UPI001F57828C|nr:MULTISPECIES: ABC transporter ATP-binding protein [Bacillus cereus group]MDW3036252.1 ABC transporter ATP-binding protein [Bacillus pacificus]